MTIPVSSNTTHPHVALPLDGAQSEQKISDKPESAHINGKQATVGSGDKGTVGLASAEANKQGFGAKLLSAGYSVVTFPATLLSSITSALGSVFHFVTNIATPPAASSPDEDLRNQERASVGARMAKHKADAAASQMAKIVENIANSDSPRGREFLAAVANHSEDVRVTQQQASVVKSTVSENDGGNQQLAKAVANLAENGSSKEEELFAKLANLSDNKSV